MKRVIIGVDPHKLSATIEVVDQRENLLGSGKFTTDKAGFAAMRKYVNQWQHREWQSKAASAWVVRWRSAC
jgi:transposase